MTFPVRLAVAIVLAAAADAAAQAPPPETPPAQARVQLGPLGVRPALVLRDVGIDSNVFNEPEARSDFTATVGAKFDLDMRFPRIVANYSSTYEYMYFKTYETERGSNRSVDGRVDVLLGRLRPYFGAGAALSHDRPTAEIDARAERQQSRLEAGLVAAPFSRTTFNLGYRHTDSEFDGEETFRGASLAGELNGTSEALLVGADMELTPFTTVGIQGEHLQERFDFSPDRDARSYRLGATATLHQLALISGRISIGVRAFRPDHPVVRDFTGVTAAIAANYTLREQTRFNVTIDRDLRHSFLELTPYYISTGARLTVTQRLQRSFDLQGIIGAERIAYEARLDAGLTSSRDVVTTVGGGIGYRLADGSRLGLNVDHTYRTSPVDTHEYSRTRLYSTLTYGF